MQVLTFFSDLMEPPALLSADHVFSPETDLPTGLFHRIMSWNRDWSNSSWASSSWDKNGSSGWNNRDWQRGPSNRSGSSPPSQSSVLGGTVSIPSSFTPDWECYDTNSVSNKKFFRNIQSTPWSTKNGLAGKGIADLRVTELARKGLDDFSLRCLSNGEFQSIVFVKSISEAVFVSNLLRHIRQDRSDLDAVAANMHGPAPPDKHKESARFMQPLLGEVVSTSKSHAPAPTVSSAQSPESAELAKAKRKLQEAGIALTPGKKARAAQGSPSSTGPTLPTTGSKSPAAPTAKKLWTSGSRNTRANFVAKPVHLRNMLQTYAPCRLLKSPSMT